MIRKIICVNAVVFALIAVVFLIYPSVRAFVDTRDPGLQQPGVPKAAWRLYRHLTPRYAEWARERVSQGRADALPLQDISGTEWPLFGSVFYLWGIENLQAAWEAGDHRAGLEPRVYARAAIVAASELVIDPKHASWVKKHWGDEYLHRENVFYRMLVMAALTSREKLLHDGAHLDRLRDQVETFAQELDASKTGLLDDYPGECYPGDVMAAIMCVQRADAVLGTNRLYFVSRALRGFTAARATRYQLPPYSADSKTGLPISEARGCASSYMCLTSPELWPTQAKQWFGLYDRFFWQERIGAVGYRELPRGVPRSQWTIDVDAGPVIAGHGVAASAFGVGAARKNGRFDRAYPLAAEMLATVVELPNGAMAVPRLLSNLSDAPLLGEAAILWQLSTQPEKGFPVRTGGSIPPYVHVVLAVLFGLGTWRILAAAWTFRNARRRPEPEVGARNFQIALWLFCLIGAAAAFATVHILFGIVALLIALILPITKRKRRSKAAEDLTQIHPWTVEKPAQQDPPA